MRNYFITLLITSVISYSGLGQNWSSIVTSSCTEQNEGISVKLFNGQQYFTGVYSGNLNIGFNSIIGLQYDDIFVGRADLNGNTQWLINIRGTLIDRPNHIDIINDQVVVAGTFSDSLFIGNDTLINQYQRAVFIAYFDTLGNHLSTFVPDVYNAEIKDFAVDHDGNLLISGDFFQHFNYGGFSMTSISGLNFFLAKYDPIQDSILWGVSATASSSEGKKISIDTANNIYVTGLYNDGSYLIDTLLSTGNANHNLFVAKFNSLGDKLWLETVEGVAEVHAYGLVCDDSSNVFLLGEFEGTIIIEGVSLISSGFYDAIMIKYNPNGSVLWAEAFGGTDSDEGYDLALDDNMDPVVMLEAGINVMYQGQTLLINGWNEPLLLKVKNSNGELLWYKSLNSTTASGLVNGAAISLEGEYIALTGTNRSSILFNSNEYVAANTKDFYSVILKDSLTYFLDIENLTDQNPLVLYPNPAFNNFSILSDQIIDMVEVYSMTGQLIDIKHVSSSNPTITIPPTTKSGLCLIHVWIGNSLYIKKLIIK
ncbi:MAG: T9SS type A sorting domain-containing protein [Crocinitomicaceae bacterium]|nr:T9SS type A sorting domain-containing protein [Crocinitomicaceae bacterium]